MKAIIFSPFFILLCNLFSIDSQANEVVLTWNPIYPVPDGYRLYQRSTVNPYYHDWPVWTGRGNSCSIDIPANDTIHCFVVRAFMGEDESEDSNEVCVKRIDGENLITLVNIKGLVIFNGMPVCAMVLANGEYMFTCEEGGNFGKYDLYVPIDANGEITVQSFVDGLAPFIMIAGPYDLAMDIDMEPYIPESQSPEVTIQIESDSAVPEDWVRINGTVTLGDIPLCAMVLANGLHMFSCDANNGKYDLTIPLDEYGEFSLFVFVSGLRPYQSTYLP